MSYLRVIKRLPLILVLIFVSLSAKAQFVDCTTGLLIAPSADMNESGTFMITNNFLNEHYTPTLAGEFPFDYNTFGYGFNITFWSRLEVAYICTLFNGKWSPSARTERAKIILNQDRHFYAKVLALKEGEIWKWTPSIAIGVSDPTSTNTGATDYSQMDGGFFYRAYIVATKHFSTSWGEVGGHLGYQYTPSKNFLASGPIAAITWRPVWLRNRWFDPKFVLEYDARTPNIGFIADIWDDRFEAMFCLQNFQWVSFGLRFKLRLKGSE